MTSSGACFPGDLEIHEVQVVRDLANYYFVLTDFTIRFIQLIQRKYRSWNPLLTLTSTLACHTHGFFPESLT
jgi:hypothetical protein